MLNCPPHGATPVHNGLYEMLNFVSLLRLVNDVGIGPVNLLWERSRLWRHFIPPSDMGKDPLKLLRAMLTLTNGGLAIPSGRGP